MRVSARARRPAAMAVRKSCVRRVSGRSLLDGGLERVAHLAQDLRLAEHEGVEAGGHATEVARDVLARVDVEVIEQQLARNVVRRRERVDELVARVLDAGGQACVQLDAVTRLERGVLEDGRAALGAEPERADAFAQLDGSRSMAESEADEAVHAV